jgi:citrate lyase beta subunit
MRAFLFVPADSRAEARSTRDRSWTRVNALETTDLLSDLPAAVPLRPAGIVLPKIRGCDGVLIVSRRRAIEPTLQDGADCVD